MRAHQQIAGRVQQIRPNVRQCPAGGSIGRPGGWAVAVLALLGLILLPSCGDGENDDEMPAPKLPPETAEYYIESVPTGEVVGMAYVNLTSFRDEYLARLARLEAFGKHGGAAEAISALAKRVRSVVVYFPKNLEHDKPVVLLRGELVLDDLRAANSVLKVMDLSEHRRASNGEYAIPVIPKRKNHYNIEETRKRYFTPVFWVGSDEPVVLESAIPHDGILIGTREAAVFSIEASRLPADPDKQDEAMEKIRRKQRADSRKLLKELAAKVDTSAPVWIAADLSQTDDSGTRPRITGSFHPLGDRAGRITCTFPAERPAERFAEKWADASDNTALGRLLRKADIRRDGKTVHIALPGSGAKDLPDDVLAVLAELLGRFQ